MSRPRTHVYLRQDFDYTSDGHKAPPTGCLVIERQYQPRGDAMLAFGISICAPEDQMSKWTGLQIARERLMEVPYVIPERRLMWTTDDTFIDVLHEILEHAKIADKAWPMVSTLNLQAIRTAIKHLYPRKGIEG